MANENLEQGLHSIAKAIQNGVGTIVENTFSGNQSFTGTSYTTLSSVNLNLPSEGTWLLMISIRCQISLTTAGRFAIYELYDNTAGASIPASERIMYGDTAYTHVENILWLMPVTVTQATEIVLRGKRNSGSGFNYSYATDDVNGDSYLCAIKIGKSLGSM